ncbi:MULTISPECIES: DoxX family protein [unclassified Coleofasciculus]|uniref:DoxX family protein n=1 Tax=unclassified Coleofasciculus TaxID=2692782 RepID=UPI001880D09A|nr:MULTISPECIES: DoxX family protein [unclassified Coleofasciculus]MBE9128694.1 DoxX family protein [Coleofasciculus sp. LEGE 07081]MBE9151480.1 DoxX family protein [Coleofasciculus sp. LEGE 07092]
MASQPTPWLRRRDIVTAYTLLRIVLGVNFFNHGFTRLGSIPAFAQSMVDLFQDTFIPEPLVRAPSFLVPIVEFIVGILVTLGLANQAALITGFGLMIVLMYGVTLLQNWDTATSQLIYCLVFFILIAANSFNSFSLDAWIKRRKDLS